jgi:hypothetical protein
MKNIIIAILFAISTVLVNAQGYYTGQISRPDIFGNQQIRYSNGLSGTLSRPDIFGSQTLRYNNGTTFQYGSPDIFGNRQIRVHTMPRSYGYGY